MKSRRKLIMEKRWEYAKAAAKKSEAVYAYPFKDSGYFIPAPCSIYQATGYAFVVVCDRALYLIKTYHPKRDRIWMQNTRAEFPFIFNEKNIADLYKDVEKPYKRWFEYKVVELQKAEELLNNK